MSPPVIINTFPFIIILSCLGASIPKIASFVFFFKETL